LAEESNGFQDDKHKYADDEEEEAIKESTVMWKKRRASGDDDGVDSSSSTDDSSLEEEVSSEWNSPDEPALMMVTPPTQRTIRVMEATSMGTPLMIGMIEAMLGAMKTIAAMMTSMISSPTMLLIS
jgi:hypothetical protein